MIERRHFSLAAPVCWGLSLALAVAASPTLRPAAGSELRRTATVRAIEQARGSIVNIHGQKTVLSPDENVHRGDAPQHVNGMGTGVVIDERGYIITNYHVVEGVKRIQVTLAGGQAFVAALVSHDPRTDLAIIKISPKEDLPVITVGTSSDLMTGEPVIAIGNAYGYEHTVTRGIVSALHRTVHVSDAQQYQDLIQTDASINPGNSGGPLLNIDGEMIGINVAVRAGAQGIGFAIPVDMAMEIAARLMSVERVEGVTHGVKAAPGAATRQEFVVGDVAEESPAAKSGLRPGDVITRAADKPVTRGLDFERALLDHKAGDQIELVVRRDQQPLTVNLVLAAKARSTSSSARAEVATAEPASATSPAKNRDAAKIWDVLGLKLEEVPAKQLRQTGTQYRGGMMVVSVRPDSPAARQGIRRGDVLVGLHIWETISLENVAYVLNRPDFEELEPMKFFILRNNESKFGHLSVSLRK
ncbi:MAG TPA: trypsin-like peptidase domain-containing protein [Pirellulales bacterium]|jgi:serine protease Do|nr:trypsin-like peptidase domain-containing protein [Pirellulales bacterium]